MIKINLLTSSVTAGSADPAVVGSDEQIKRRAYTNLAVFLILPVSLFLYASQTKPAKVAQIASLNAELESLRNFNTKEANIVAEISKIKEDEKNVQIRIDALQKVTLGRLAEIKALDLIQTLVKERMWLTDFKVDAGKVEMVGIAQSELDINQFQDEMTRNILLKGVYLEKSELTNIEGQNFTKFIIKANLEKSK